MFQKSGKRPTRTGADSIGDTDRASRSVENGYVYPESGYGFAARSAQYQAARPHSAVYEKFSSSREPKHDFEFRLLLARCHRMRESMKG
jgi:hypothetical protein